MKYLLVAFILGVLVCGFISLHQLEIEEQQQRVQQKQDYLDCLKKVANAFDQIGWCYDKFIQ